MTKYNEVPNMHAILVKYHGPTNTRGSRVSMYSYRFNVRVSVSYDYDKRDIGEMAYNALVRRGFNIVGISEVKEGYILLSNTFDSIKRVV
jgi:hypothetical protein